MLKTPMPLCFYSIAIIVATPTAANPGHVPLESGQNVLYTGITHTQKDAPIFTLTNRKGIKFVNAYIRNNDECLTIVRRRSEMAFAVIDSIFDRYRLPLELKYLAVVESELKSTAVSRVGAKGPWQLMPATAQELGLMVNSRSDERKDLVKSTRAAAAYLRDLHREFGDWLLVLAAYNGGPVPVYRAIHKAHSRNFWALQQYLPAESRMHVKKFIATTYYFERKEAQPKMEDIAGLAIGVKPLQETSDQKFSRLMKESARSLRESNELMELEQ